MKQVAIKCPGCGATSSFQTSNGARECEYCGTQFRRERRPRFVRILPRRRSSEEKLSPLYFVFVALFLVVFGVVTVFILSSWIDDDDFDRRRDEMLRDRE